MTLAGQRILVAESRELDLFAAMLDRAGAVVTRCPLVAILPVEDEAPALAWLRRLIADRHDDLVLYTGEGLKRLMAIARPAGLEDEAVRAIARRRVIVRGPKPTRVLRQLGLAPALAAEPATTEGLMAVMRPLGLAGRRIALQLYPDQPPAMLDFLAAEGAVADPVLPYRYADHSDDASVLRAIEAMDAGEINIVAFTSTPQVRRLAEVAARHGAAEALRRGMARTRVAAIGPVTADALAAAGWTRVLSPAESFHLKPMVAAMGRDGTNA